MRLTDKCYTNSVVMLLLHTHTHTRSCILHYRVIYKVQNQAQTVYCSTPFLVEKKKKEKVQDVELSNKHEQAHTNRAATS